MARLFMDWARLLMARLFMDWARLLMARLFMDWARLLMARLFMDWARLLMARLFMDWARLLMARLFMDWARLLMARLFMDWARLLMARLFMDWARLLMARLFMDWARLLMARLFMDWARLLMARLFMDWARLLMARLFMDWARLLMARLFMDWARLLMARLFMDWARLLMARLFMDWARLLMARLFMDWARLLMARLFMDWARLLMARLFMDWARLLMARLFMDWARLLMARLFMDWARLLMARLFMDWARLLMARLFMDWARLLMARLFMDWARLLMARLFMDWARLLMARLFMDWARLLMARLLRVRAHLLRARYLHPCATSLEPALVRALNHSPFAMAVHRHVFWQCSVESARQKVKKVLSLSLQIHIFWGIAKKTKPRKKGILVGIFIVIILLVLSFCLTSRKKARRANDKLPVSQIPNVSKEIKEIKIDQNSANHFAPRVGDFLALHDNFSDNDSDKFLLRSSVDKTNNADNSSQSGSFNHLEKDGYGSQSGEKGCIRPLNVFRPSSHPITVPSPLTGLPEFSHLGWGHWFTLRDLEIATNRFSKENIIGEGGYGVVYQGHLINGTPVAVKNLLNNLGQAEKEFSVEVEAIGHVRHKNLVRLLGYCIEGTHRLLVYEYVNNGNLEQWLHGAMRQHGYLTWEARMKILLGTAKALAYLHEAIEPKVIHRDIKSSNILIDDDFNAKISDFGLAKLLGAGTTHITTRVMGTFGYVAPEYANSGLLNEKSDVYSFGVVLLEAITGRDPVDYGRPAHQYELEWQRTPSPKSTASSHTNHRIATPFIFVYHHTSTTFSNHNHATTAPDDS
ncbi:hypothetical protein TEA_028703 [Camellia sinensis var. sinensis]|uniref:non-specific serine/threonine protein kinase n=1 Tax=Camellia sinensis var. sinensis TaxID=542762 RepID=A0A4S4F105_CAMSN|nr:hypothetical protein TEA_028703 [Camellia sinensis var. sinensis]